ncbi:MAG: 2-polyprenyl-3-methyl-6-methoxy-1,4-benzoquinone monooxygenase [Gammaproteobacteria bacterium]|nr:2-polyprenyl-3-methyl-6-methoxy-1,4-benzoquinone monooxygenase [Gammaproteobacteria bacterium]MBU1654726.1 2-polyprenyl-3-methyl-6-methoxy-1,4-benzoquinone monooxygenase [Gammaproteobacteria bacterium]MBU1959647.1 2-polyprenyl-3-methyl-6-methoxy-1,4-benzoquinone monooxygenase [Gammaproteobacteria bacterium]
MTLTTRNLMPADKLVIGLDNALRTLFGKPQMTERTNPAATLPELEMNDSEKLHAARLMRINHTGEVCAQALYQGQGASACLGDVRAIMERAAMEENDHLDWCEKRLEELDNRKSILNPFWYLGSFLIGATAGMAGDKWSLGFVAETERQVTAHLEDHLSRLPPQDQKSRAILEQMKEDELRHATSALKAGAVDLPIPIRSAMKLTSRVMTKSVYYL